MTQALCREAGASEWTVVDERSQVQVKLTAGLLLMARGTALQSVTLLDDVLMEGMTRYDQGRKVEDGRRTVVGG
jgi:hypothetical protein